MKGVRLRMGRASLTLRTPSSAHTGTPSSVVPAGALS